VKSHRVGIAVLTAMASLVTGCSAGGDHATTGQADPRPLNGPVIDLFLPATGPQLTEGLGFFTEVNVLENAIAFRCMADHRFGPDAMPLVRYTEKYMDPLQGSPEVPGWQGENTSGVPNLYNLSALEHGGLLGEVLTGSPNAPSLAAPEANAIYEYYYGCQSAAARTFAPIENDGTALSRIWLHTVAAIQASPRVRSAYSGFGTCARKSGAPASARTSPDSFRNWLTGQITPPMPDPYGHAAMIASELRLDRRWTAVFISCIKPLLPVQDKLQFAAQKSFIKVHYQQVLALVRTAGRLVSRVQGQYRPGTGT
jgi:hypothetical protein